MIGFCEKLCKINFPLDFYHKLKIFIFSPNFCQSTQNLRHSYVWTPSGTFLSPGLPLPRSQPVLITIPALIHPYFYQQRIRTVSDYLFQFLPHHVHGLTRTPCHGFLIEVVRGCPCQSGPRGPLRYLIFGPSGGVNPIPTMPLMIGFFLFRFGCYYN